MTQEEMNILVPQKLQEISEKHKVTILYAAESGSRAWGFASPDSDFDVRFIYKRTQEDYLRLNMQRDVIEIPVDETWDVSGWDLRKALILLHKSNPSLYEWMGSPVCYHNTDFKDRFLPLLQGYFSEKRMLYHYLSMARNNRRDYLTGEYVKPKKYLYTLRPLLACRWIIEKHRPPPVVFSELMAETLPLELRDAMETLLAIKMSGDEAQEISHMQALDNYIEDAIEELLAFMQQYGKEETKSWDQLNDFFLEQLKR